MKKKFLLLIASIYLLISIGLSIIIIGYYRLIPVSVGFFKSGISGSSYGNSSSFDFDSLMIDVYSNEGIINLIIAFSVTFFLLSNFCFYKYFNSKN